MRFFEKTHISVYDGSLKGLCKMIELILGKKLEPNHLQKVLARTNVSRLGLQYIKKNSLLMNKEAVAVFKMYTCVKKV